jgi:hypothetical protein
VRHHDREVITNHVGELVQHDASFHRWSPYAADKWYLITSVDDYSRYMLYAVLVGQETSWQHIAALEAVCVTYGFPLTYYVDCHSTFRFVQYRDSLWRKHHIVTDEADPQWKQVAQDCRIRISYALSPQAKGKIERPYRWLQDHLVRTCAREHLTSLDQVREVLHYEVQQYNDIRVHSTTREIPRRRFERSLREGKHLFRPFTLPPPYQSTRDLFALRLKRVVNSYRKISLFGIEFKIPGVNPFDEVALHITPDDTRDIAVIRCWHHQTLVTTQTIKLELLNRVQF